MIAYQICGNLEDAKDIAQDTFLRAFRYRHRFQAGRRLASWLNRIAVNAAIDFLKRREDPGVAVPVEEAWKGSRGAAAAARIASPERGLAARQETARLLNLLDMLAPRERAAFVLRYLQGQSTAEVARAMGCTRITVRRHALRAREKLRAALAREDRPRDLSIPFRSAGLTPLKESLAAAAPKKR